MATKDFKRKLSAIFSADVAGYSRLMGEDEAATVEAITTYREIMGGLIRQHRGRVVDSPGDNILAEFASVVDAVQCAVAVQKELQARNAELPENRRMEFRIGINLGDVIEEEDRIYGDGVNIAARLEALADPGGICVSKTAFDHIETKLPLGYEYLGEQDVKNISKAVGAYRVLMDPRVTVAGAVEKEDVVPMWRRKTIIAASVAVIVVAIGLGIWNFYFRPPPIEPASVERMAYPLPDKPSIAVLPFDNLSGESDQDYFADGIAEDIITQLSQIHNLFVIARNSSFSYKGKQVKIRQVAEELGVRYVLEGSVQKSGDQVRITAQLIDAITGRHLWADRYDRELKDVFAVQDDIAHKVVTELAVTLSEGENERFMLRGTENREAWVLYRKAVAQFRRFKKGANLKARELSEQAVALDSNYSQPYSLLSWTYAWPVRFGLSSSPAEDLKKAEELANKASDLNSSNHDAQNVLGFIYMVRGQYDKAIIQGKRAVELNPNMGDTYALLALSQNFAGHYDDAIDSMLKAMRLAPFYPPWFLSVLGEFYFMAGKYEEALEAFNQLLKKGPIALRRQVWIAAAYIALDQPEKAKVEAKQILKKQPTFSLEAFSKKYPFKNRSDFDRVLAFAREAGLPDKPPLPLPDKPSIAVLPFVNMSGDPKQEYFSDGITEEIITALSKTPKLFVIARNSTFTYKGKPIKVQLVGRELGVKYVLEGTVRKSGNKVRITAQLVDARTGHHIWAERYDRGLKDIFAIQDEVTKKIITSVHVKLTEGEQGRLYAKGTANLDAYLKASEASWYLRQSTKEGLLKAKQLAEDAIALDPNYPSAYNTLGMFYGISIWLGMSKSPADSLKRAIELSQKAISLDESFAYGHVVLGYWLAMARQYSKAIAEGERAVVLEPGSADIIHNYAAILSYAGRRKEAIPLFREAMRLNPMPPNSYYRHFAITLRESGQYEEAIAMHKKAIERAPNDLISYIGLTLDYAYAGRMEEARATANEVLRIKPTFSADHWGKVMPNKDPAVTRKNVEALKKAGLK